MELAALEGHKKTLDLHLGKQSYHFLACLIFDPFNTCRSLYLQVTKHAKQSRCLNISETEPGDNIVGVSCP